MTYCKRSVFSCFAATASVCFAAVFVLCCDAFAREDDYTLKAKNACNNEHARYTVLILEENPPISWVTSIDRHGSSDAYGIGYIILQKLLKAANIAPANVSVRAAPDRKDLLYRTSHKPVDTAIGIQYTPDLDMTIQNQFILPAYLVNPIVAVFLKGKEKEINSTADLVGLNGAVLAKDNFISFFPKDMYLTEVGSVREAYDRLFTGNMDYILMGYYAAELEAKKFKVEDKIVISPKALRRVNNYLTLNPDLLCGVFKQDFDALMKEITSDKKLMQNILYEAYQEYERQNKNFPAFKPSVITQEMQDSKSDF